MKTIDEIAKKMADEAADGLDPEQWPRTSQDAVEAWSPSAEQIADWIAQQGWPTFDDFSTDHLSPEERARLEKAITAARRYVKMLREDPGVAMIIVAGNTPGDEERTGYGCGKTMLARCIYYANAHARWTPNGDYLTVIPNGRFYEAREIMALFDRSEDFNVRSFFREFGNTVIIDDVGREGNLKWERRDPELQLKEKQDRYYNIIDYCYDRGVNIAITSNMSAKELANFLGGASWSRLLQMCPPQFRVNMTGIRDMRPLLGKKHGENFGF